MPSNKQERNTATLAKQMTNTIILINGFIRCKFIDSAEQVGEHLRCH